MDIESNMEVLGKRHPFLARYKAGIDESGIVLFVSMKIYSDSGFSFFEDTSGMAFAFARVKKYNATFFNSVLEIFWVTTYSAFQLEPTFLDFMK